MKVVSTDSENGREGKGEEGNGGRVLTWMIVQKAGGGCLLG